MYFVNRRGSDQTSHADGPIVLCLRAESPCVPFFGIHVEVQERIRSRTVDRRRLPILGFASQGRAASFDWFFLALEFYGVEFRCTVSSPIFVSHLVIHFVRYFELHIASHFVLHFVAHSVAHSVSHPVPHPVPQKPT